MKQMPLKDVAEEKAEETVVEGTQFGSVYWQPCRNGWCYTQRITTSSYVQKQKWKLWQAGRLPP